MSAGQLQETVHDAVANGTEAVVEQADDFDSDYDNEQQIARNVSTCVVIHSVIEVGERTPRCPGFPGRPQH